MKKLFTLLFILLVSLINFSGTISFGEEVSKQALSPYVNKLEDKIVHEQLEGSLFLDKQVVETVQYGDLGANVWLEQNVQTVTMSANNEAIQVVSWAKSSANAWEGATVRNIALDFEAKNPGWMVAAAINGDFFDIGNTYQPLNTFVQNGDVLRRDTRSFPGGVLGFYDDNSYCFGNPTSLNELSLKVYDENVEIDNIPISCINETPSTMGVTLLTTSLATPIDLTGFEVYIGNYELNRESGSGLFIKGEITSFSDDFEIINSIPTGDFYIVSQDHDFDNGTKIKCEYSLSGDFSEVTNTVGYQYQVLDKGDVLYQGVTKSDNAFIGTAHPRTLVGIKEDGSIIFMVVDGRQPSIGCNGVSLFEAGELLRIKGAYNGFNLDGGGSSTLIVRNELGEFEVINSPSDGSERRVGNALLFVIQDPQIEITNISDSSITFEQIGELPCGSIEDISIRVGGKTYPMVDNMVVVTDLLKATPYDIVFYYKIRNEDGTLQSCISRTYRISTTYKMPTIEKFEVSKTNATSVDFRFDYDDEDELVTNAYLSYGSEISELDTTRGTVTIDDLVTNQTYDVQLILVLNDGTRVKSEILSVTPETVKSGCTVNSYLISELLLLSIFFIMIRQRKQ